MSISARIEVLATEAGLHEYQRAFPLPSRDLPALWLVHREDINAVGLVAEPHPLADKPFGEYHYQTDRCPTESEAAGLAERITLRGCLLAFVRH